MGVDFSLAAVESKEFISLHKWPVVELAGQQLLRSYFPSDGYHGDATYLVEHAILGVKAVRIPPIVLRESVRNLRLGDAFKWIEDTAPYVADFVSQHEDQTIFLVCDAGDEPWGFGMPGWILWREMEGPHFFHSFLPRNLYQDLGCRNWDQALKHLLDKHDWLLHCQMAGEADEIRRVFEELVACGPDDNWT